MLRDLRVQRFALLDDVRVTFGPRLNVLTGETGAGKSILIDAITMVLGGRASSDLIRSGCEEAVVEASFSVQPGSKAADELAAMDYPADDDVVVQRVVSVSGKGRIYLNGRPVTLSGLARVTGHLIDVHSQHEYQSLGRAETPLMVLDAFARIDQLRRDFREAWAQWSSLDQIRSSLSARADVRRREIDLLRHEVEELAGAAVRPGEWEELERERAVCRYAERLKEASCAARVRLQDQDGGGVLDGVRAISSELRAAAGLDATLAEAAALADSAAIQLQELAGVLDRYGESIGQDEGRLDAIESRLADLQRLRRKYGVAAGELNVLLERKREQLGVLEREGEADHSIGPRAAAARQRVEALADDLHARRIEAAGKLATLIDGELVRLRLSARFHVDVAPLDDRGTIGPLGRDRVDFLLSANPGEPPRPLRKIASGGELSRIMLAIKSVLASVDPVPTLIFDEADAGVGGAVAEVVGRRLRAIADHRQVLCVTHLPQVASGADTHLLVEKTVERGRTSTRVRQLGGRERVREIARMLTGQSITDTALRHAEEMIRLVAEPAAAFRSQQDRTDSGRRPGRLDLNA